MGSGASLAQHSADCIMMNDNLMTLIDAFDMARQTMRVVKQNIIFILIPLCLVLLVAAVCAFFWAIKNDQFDGLDSPAWRILLDDDRQPPGVDKEQ
jgi:cbb3-type cytochrome oxidase maturation protein